MADDLDLLTLDEAKRAINMDITTAEQDDILGRHITTISRIIDDRCGPVVQRPVAGELHNGGGSLIELRRYPVASVSLVREAQYGTVTTLTVQGFGSIADGFQTPTWDRDPTLLSGILLRRRYGCRYPWWPGDVTVEVTYVAGRVADTASVDARFKDAAGAVLRRLWKREAGTWAQSSTFFEDNDHNAGAGFFKVAVPVIDELLWDEIQTHVVNIA